MNNNYYGGEDNQVEAIKVIEGHGLNFNRGNIIKYVLRAGKKNPLTELEDLKKASYYLNREIEKLKNNEQTPILRPSND